METSKCGLFINALLDQLDDTYEYGVEVKLDDLDPDRFDCSEIVQWGLARAQVAKIGGVPLRCFDGAGTQFCAAREIPVDHAHKGCLLFRRDPKAYPTKPAKIGHVGVVIGPGWVLHASSSKGKVIVSRITAWWNRAAKVDELYQEEE